MSDCVIWPVLWCYFSIWLDHNMFRRNHVKYPNSLLFCVFISHFRFIRLNFFVCSIGHRMNQANLQLNLKAAQLIVLLLLSLESQFSIWFIYFLFLSILRTHLRAEIPNASWKWKKRERDTNPKQANRNLLVFRSETHEIPSDKSQINGWTHVIFSCSFSFVSIFECSLWKCESQR